MFNKVKKRLPIEYFYSLTIFTSLLFFFYRAPIELLSDNYDIDIDHEMYFGSRLIVGELLYTKELHDKLPLVQFLFYIPALYKSVFAFKIFSLSLVILSSILLYNFFLNYFHYFETTTDTNQKYITALTSCSIYLALHALLFLFHVSTIASCLLMISIIFFFRHNAVKYKLLYRSKFIYYVISVFCGSCAISMRPYLFASIISVLLCSLNRDILLLNTQIITITLQNIVKYLIITLYQLFKYLACLLACTVIINMTPYMLTNNLVHFYDGIRHNLQKLNPENVGEILQHQEKTILKFDITLKIEILFIIFILIQALLIFIFSKALTSNSRKLFIYDLFFNVVCTVFLLEVVILTRHFWPHYLEMFIPFMALGIGYMVAFTLIGFKTHLQLFWHFGKYSRYIVYTLVFFLGMVSPYHLSHPYLLQLNVAERVLEARTSLGLPVDFLYVTNMYVHWKLMESRHGFPHAANIDHIGRGWWGSVEKTTILEFPYSREDLCNKLQRSQISVIFTELNSFSFECMKKIPQEYKQDNYENIYYFSKID